MFIVIMEHVIQCNYVAYGCVYCFGVTVEVNAKE